MIFDKHNESRNYCTYKSFTMKIGCNVIKASIAIQKSCYVRCIRYV